MKQEISMFPNAFIYDTSIFFFILSVITYNINVIVSYLKCFNTLITINYHTKLSTKQQNSHIKHDATCIRFQKGIFVTLNWD